MPSKHKTGLLGWHPPAELAAWVRADAEQREVPLSVVLNEALVNLHRERSDGSVPPKGATEPTAVYRLYDATGALLYVGVSVRPSERWAAHAVTRPWWPDVADRRVEWFRDRESALEAERRAIRDEGPLHNVVHNGVRPATPAARAKPVVVRSETARQAEEALIEWAMRQADRDNLVRAALAADIPKQRIHELTGIARTTIDRIIKGES